MKATVRSTKELECAGKSARYETEITIEGMDKIDANALSDLSTNQILVLKNSDKIEIPLPENTNP